jgi:hypothetical protein
MPSNLPPGVTESMLPGNRQEDDEDRNKEIYEVASGDPRLKDGDLELDNGAKVSEGDENGAYIQVWMWVSFEGTKLDKDKEAAASDASGR